MDDKSDLKQYLQLCDRKSDINQHLPTLSEYAGQCSVILEAGVRSVISTWAFLNGIRSNGDTTKTIYSVDISPAPIDPAKEMAKTCGVKLQFTQSDILKYELPEMVDLTFIDTFHCYGQLKRELQKLAPMTKKYIILHDTTVDGVRSEVVRLPCSYNLNKLIKELGWSKEELTTGLWPAVTEFLAKNMEWKLHERFLNNNGLTILKRHSQ